MPGAGGWPRARLSAKLGRRGTPRVVSSVPGALLGAGPRGKADSVGPPSQTPGAPNRHFVTLKLTVLVAEHWGGQRGAVGDENEAGGHA